MIWLDFWPLPWMLYGALSLRVLTVAGVAALALALAVDASQLATRRVR
jgi:hypothetical protein